MMMCDDNILYFEGEYIVYFPSQWGFKARSKRSNWSHVSVEPAECWLTHNNRNTSQECMWTINLPIIFDFWWWQSFSSLAKMKLWVQKAKEESTAINLTLVPMNYLNRTVLLLMPCQRKSSHKYLLRMQDEYSQHNDTADRKYKEWFLRLCRNY